MSREITIFELDPSVEDDRPVIDFELKANQKNDWQRLDLILRGEKPIADYEEVQISIARPDAGSWGFFSIPGTLGVISSEAVERIGRAVFRLYDLLPAQINRAKYFFLKSRETLPCLDRDRSEITTFRRDPSRVKEVTKCVFLKDRVSDPLVFSIPESVSRMFATTTVREMVVHGRISGFRFTALD